MTRQMASQEARQAYHLDANLHYLVDILVSAHENTDLTVIVCAMCGLVEEECPRQDSAEHAHDYEPMLVFRQEIDRLVYDVVNLRTRRRA